MSINRSSSVDTMRRCDPHHFSCAGHDFAPFDLRTAEIENIGQPIAERHEPVQAVMLAVLAQRGWERQNRGINPG
jgi:hypothetical protein